jgi:hypothetical protein
MSKIASIFPCIEAVVHTCAQQPGLAERLSENVFGTKVE